MNYSNLAEKEVRNFESVQFVGYDPYTQPFSVKNLFSDSTTKYISGEITKFLGTDIYNRPIEVPDKTIWSVLSGILSSYSGNNTNIMSRYTIPRELGVPNAYQDLVYQTITVIVDQLKTALEMEKNNSQLSIWTTVLGDFNEKGLRSHPPLDSYINNNSRLFQINMNY